jgi:hypothetical protein
MKLQEQIIKVANKSFENFAKFKIPRIGEGQHQIEIISQNI